MKRLRQIVKDIKSLQNGNPEQLQEALWQLICYSPKMPVRLHQQQLLAEAEQITLQVEDRFFSHSTLNINCFKWGNGPIKVLLTHGWGSKAADFSELISTLSSNKNLEIWAFDAPGNGSSEGELSNLFLYAEAVKAILNRTGPVQVMISHSLGGMANVLALQESKNLPELLISIAPLINLKDNFIGSMNGVETSAAAQETFFNDFENLFGDRTERFIMNKLYDFSTAPEHLLLYDANDLVTPAADIEGFLKENPEITAVAYEETSHAKILSDHRMISKVDSLIQALPIY